MADWKQILSYAINGSPKPDVRMEKSIDEWRVILTDEQFRITRMCGTESPYSGESCEKFENGIYKCICCKTKMFDTSSQFNSGSGWPSFTESIKENVIQYIKDDSHGMVRIEVRCNVCEAHLGHVFPDGPSKK